MNKKDLTKRNIKIKIKHQFYDFIFKHKPPVIMESPRQKSPGIIGFPVYPGKQLIKSENRRQHKMKIKLQRCYTKNEHPENKQ